MNSEFRVLISGDQRLLLRISGPLNHNADFAPLRFSANSQVEVDLAGVTTINSTGIRSFSGWINGLPNETIDLSHCPKFIIDQVNMVFGFIPARAKVLSFYVPYFCEIAELEKLVLYSKGLEFEVTNGEVRLEHPTVTDNEKNEYEIDVTDRFFKFLKNFG